MRTILTNYNYTPDWVREYTNDFKIYDRSDSIEYLSGFPEERIVRVPNRGDADFDRLSYLVDNYDDLPDVFLLSKSNLFKFITPEEWDRVKNNTEFTPLLTRNHKTYNDNRGPVCFYEGGMYYERNDSWYLAELPCVYRSYDEFAADFNLPNPPYIPFAPGGNYILTKERVHKHPKEYYERMMNLLPYTIRPGEAQLIERSLYTLWK